MHYVAGPPHVSPSRIAALDSIAAEIRRDVLSALEHAGHEHRGHPGAALSIVDLVTALYFEVMRVDPARPDWPDRDRFVLSKGHGCMALYAALALGSVSSPDPYFTTSFDSSALCTTPLVSALVRSRTSTVWPTRILFESNP